MLARFAPAVLIILAQAGAQLAFDRVWLSTVVAAAVALAVPYGELPGELRHMAPMAQLLGRTEAARRRKRRRRGYRHRYYTH